MHRLSSDECEPSKASRTMLLRRTLLASTLIFVLLEIWRPCYFLTDDNLTQYLPVLSEIGHHLLAGQSPFYSDFIFGGNYNLLNDPGLVLWHPIDLLASLLVVTPAHFWMIDVLAFFSLMIATAGFVNLAYHLRQELTLKITDNWIIFYSLSFTYSFFVLTVGSSWFNFLPNYGALPWLTLGIFQKKPFSGVLLVALFSIHQIMGGFFAPLVTTTIFFSIFAIGVAVWRRSFGPVISWFGGYALAVVTLLPMLLHVIYGFLNCPRALGLTLPEMQFGRIPPLVFVPSYLMGTSFWMIRQHYDGQIFHAALAAFPAAWCLIPVLANRSKWLFLETLCLGMSALVMISVMRPILISEFMLHLPLLRSLRLPCREILEFSFFMHIFLILRPPAFTPKTRNLIAFWSVAIFLIPLLLYKPPSLNPMGRERQLLFSGELESYWNKVKKQLNHTDRIAVIIPIKYCQIELGEWAPFSLLGTHNFCCLIKVKSATGYSPTVPNDQLFLHTPTLNVFGCYEPSQVDAIWREHPDVKLMVLENRNPLKIILRSHDNSDIDLTPYIPKDISYP